MSIQVFGTPVSRGVAIGRAVLVASSRVDVAHYFVGADRIEPEIERLRNARNAVAAELAALKNELPPEAPHELAALLDVHLMLLHDESLIGATKAWISDRHYNAEWALSAQLEVLARQFDDMEDAYLRERKADVEQVVERLLRGLRLSAAGPAALGPAVAQAASDFGGEDPLVLVANDVAPADMMQFKRSIFTGFVTDVGGRTSHTAIVARSMDIPAVVGAREASRLIRQDDWVVIDGDAGVVIVDPSPIILAEYGFKQRQRELERGRLQRLLLDGFHPHRHDVGATSRFEQGASIGRVGLVPFYVGPDIGGGQELDLNAQAIEPAPPMMRGTTGFHDHQPDITVVEPAFELAAGQALLLDDFPMRIGNSDLEYTLGQINCNGSSMHFGLLSLKTDPHPHEHRQRQLGAEKTGESIPSFHRTLRDNAVERQ